MYVGMYLSVYLALCLLFSLSIYLSIYLTVKEAVEKNLLSDVALAVHSGLRIDDIINDILGKEKGDCFYLFFDSSTISPSCFVLIVFFCSDIYCM